MKVDIISKSKIATSIGDAYLMSINFEGSLEPSILKHIKIPSLDEATGVIIEGRGPIWLYSYLVHEFHVAKWVATFDPRLGQNGAAVIVESHTKGIVPGDLVEEIKAINL